MVRALENIYADIQTIQLLYSLALYGNKPIIICTRRCTKPAND
jgi:hypothetical protein